MNNTMNLEQSVIKEVATLFGNEDALRQVLSFTKKLKRVMKEKTGEKEYISKAEVMDDLREAFIELKKVEQGLAVARPVEELVNEL
ncbi:MAG: hypothetical protein J6K19_00580 [Prevotella sp.]|nr:hypothetical protein [Prevotella sp.]